MLQGLSSAVKKAEGEISVQLADLLVFLGYFALILYVGGIAYIRDYNAGWSFPVFSDQGIVETAVIFLNAVFTTAGQAALFGAAIIILAALFFIARFALRLWIGYLTILSLFVLLLLGSALIGHWAGVVDARGDKLLKAPPCPPSRRRPRSIAPQNITCCMKPRIGSSYSNPSIWRNLMSNFAS